MSRISSAAPSTTATRAATASLVVSQHGGRPTATSSSRQNSAASSRAAPCQSPARKGWITGIVPPSSADRNQALSDSTRRASACDASSPSRWTRSYSRMTSTGGPPPATTSACRDENVSRKSRSRLARSGMSNRLPPTFTIVTDMVNPRVPRRARPRHERTPPSIWFRRTAPPATAPASPLPSAPCLRPGGPEIRPTQR